MHPSLARLVRVVPRSQVPRALHPLPEPVRSDVHKPTLIEILEKRKEDAGDGYPSNIRIEPVLSKKTLRGIPKDARVELVSLLKEH